MKKRYINPEMEIVKITSIQPLLQSSVENLGGEAQEETKGLSRDFSFGGDEE